MNFDDATTERSKWPILGLLIPAILIGCGKEKGAERIKQTGTASWYGAEFKNQKTANGDIFDPNKMTAASRKLPLGSKATVTNLENGKKVTVIINDRGPYAKNRIIDLSHAAAKKLEMVEEGTAKVKVEAKLENE